jgi:thiol:disulfide interchange protein DsbD
MLKAFAAPLIFFFLQLINSPAAPSKIPHGEVELVSSVKSIQPGASFQVGLLFHLEEGWHIYWKNPGDSGLPPRLKWNLPQGLSAGEIEWPTPKRLPVGPLLDYGYEGTVLLPVTIKADTSLATAAQTLQTALRVLVCRESCIPGKANLSLVLPASQRAPILDAQYRQLFATATADKPTAVPASWQLTAKQSGSSLVLHVKGAPKSASVSFIPAHPNVIQNAAAQRNTAAEDGLTLNLRRAEAAADTLASLDGLLLVDQAGSLRAYDVASPITITGSPAQNANTAGAPAAAQAESLSAILLLAFGGGLILNLMPCVFPVLSIKILSLLDHYAGERKTVRMSGLLYTLGVLVSFWVLVGILLSLRNAGRNLGWGFQLQSPGFVAFLICLLFVMGLSLAGVFEIGTSVMNVGSGLTQRGTYSSSFFTGVLATVVATPCTAPLMGVAVGFALAQKAGVSLLVFTSMALGLAAPFLILSIFPSLGRFLPKPGAWMETLKQLMAFLLFASVIWLLWVLGQQVGMNQLALILFGLLMLGFAGWIMGRWSGSRAAQIAASLLALATVIFAVSALSPVKAQTLLTDGSSRVDGDLRWEAFTPEKLASYRASGKPVLIDFTAAWCLTCQVNDRVVFHSPVVEQHLNKSDIALLRADWTSYDPKITDTLARYGRSGIPFYVIYGSSVNAPAVTLPDGLLTPSTFLQNLEKVNL